MRCWACLGPRPITGRCRCVNRPCGSWPGSMLSTWRIPPVVAAGWWTTWPEKESQSAATECETFCGALVYGRSTISRVLRFLETHRSDSPAWWISCWSRLWIRSGPLTSPTFRCRRDASTWWRSWISSPGTCSAGSSPTALTRSSVLRLWRWHWWVAVDQRSSTPARAANSLLVTSWPDCKQRRSRSSGQAGKAATTTS